jgi:AraC-like DNA-binding protein
MLGPVAAPRRSRPQSAARPRTTADSATLRVAPLVPLPKLLREFGFDPAVVLAATGFDEAYFGNPDLPIPYRAGCRLLAHCAEVTGCGHLGLLLAERAGPEVLGLPGLLLMSARDAGTALRELVRYFDLHDRGAVVTLEDDGQTALFGYTILTEVDGAEHAYDLAMRVACNLMRSFCGEGWRPAEVLLQRRRPADSQPWRHGFGAPMRFGDERCALRFPAHWLARPLPAYNPVLHEYLRKEADRLQLLLGKGIADEVRRIVQAMVTSPPCSASRTARVLGLHERTLNRRLQAEGSSFRQLRDEVLYSLSGQMLAASSMRVAEVAVSLGYADASAFIHAFTRWAGRTPDRWRRAQHRTGPAAVGPQNRR